MKPKPRISSLNNTTDQIFKEAHPSDFKDAVNVCRTNSFSDQLFPPLKAVKLVDFDFATSSVRLSKEAESYLRSLVGAIIIISISGRSRIGKSSFLNLIVSIMSYLARNNDDHQDRRIKYEDRFKTQAGNDPVTESSDMYVVTLKGINYVFLDIEGGDDPTKPDRSWYYQTLLVTAIGASQVHIFYHEKTLGKSLLDGLKVANDLISKHGFQNTHYDLININCEDIEEDLWHSQDYLGKLEYLKGLDYSVKVLRKPPGHIKDKHALKKESCIRKDSHLCAEKCLEHPYIKEDLFSIVESLIDRTIASRIYKDSEEVISTFDAIFKAAKADLPYFKSDLSISELRCEVHRERGREIDRQFRELFHAGNSNLLSDQIKEIKRERPTLMEGEMMPEDFNGICTNTVVKISEAEVRSEQLARFVSTKLLEPSFKVYGEKEKTVIMQVYVQPLISALEKIHGLVTSYDEIITTILGKIKQAKSNFQRDQMRNNIALFNLKSGGIFAGNCLITGGVLFLSREVVVKAVAGCIAGGAVVGIIATGVSLIQVKKALDEKRKEIAEKYRLQDALISIDNAIKYVDELWNELSASQDDLRKLLNDTQSLIQNLDVIIGTIIDNKINNRELERDEVLLVRNQTEKCQMLVRWFQAYI